MKRTLGHFVPIAFCVCVLSVGLLLCGSAVAKGATVVQKAAEGQVNLLTSEMVQPSVVLPDIAGALTVNNSVTPATTIADVALATPLTRITKQTPATTSPGVRDFECAITKVCAAAKYGLVVTRQPVLSVVRT
ncbi:MAG: hypothetical protein K8Q97_01715 [Candidatus Andersenbacteria bacterium]|nr:hypothetical protein [Candidatus Andersenbacteria bacterium]